MSSNNDSSKKYVNSKTKSKQIDKPGVKHANSNVTSDENKTIDGETVACSGVIITTHDVTLEKVGREAVRLKDSYFNQNVNKAAIANSGNQRQNCAPTGINKRSAGTV